MTGLLCAPGGTWCRAGTKSAPSWAQVGTKSKCSTLQMFRERRGAQGTLRANRRDEVPGPSPAPLARGRIARDDHPRHAAELEAAVPHH